MPVRNLTIYDIAAYLIPGSILTLFIYLIPSVNESIGAVLPTTFGGDAGFATFFLLVSYVVGTLFQTILSDRRIDEGAVNVANHLSTLPLFSRLFSLLKKQKVLTVMDQTPFETEFEHNFKKNEQNRA